MESVEKSVGSLIEKHGNPSILNGRDYQTAKDIYELRDKADFATYSYIKDEETGGLVCVGKSLGYPIPASVQIANPEKYVNTVRKAGVIILPQAEANGLFMPQGLDATYQRIIDPATGEAKLGYFEDKLNVYPFEVPGAKRPCSELYPS